MYKLLVKFYLTGRKKTLLTCGWRRNQPVNSRLYTVYVKRDERKILLQFSIKTVELWLNII